MTKAHSSSHQLSVRLKAEARGAILGHLGTAVGSNALYLLILLILEFLVNAALPEEGISSIILAELFSFLIGIFAGVLEYGLKFIYMNLQYGQETRVSDLFAGLRENQNKITRIMAFLSMISTLCSLPAVIAAYTQTGTIGSIIVWVLAAAGVIAVVYFNLVYALTFYILLDFPDMESREVLQRSRVMMNGRKKNLLWLHLSFLPLWLLSVLSFGIAGLWVHAYVRSADAAFYKDLMEQRNS